MESKTNDQILQARNIPAKPHSSHHIHQNNNDNAEKQNTMTGISDVDQKIAAETQIGENAGVTVAQEKHHHHHHHRHRNIFHSSIRNLSDLWNFIRKLCQKSYTLAYVIVFVMFLFSILFASSKCLLFVNSFRSMMTPGKFYRFQEYIFMHQSRLMSLPMQIALVAIVIILLYVRTMHPSKFNAYFMRMFPALAVAIFFSLPIFHVSNVMEDRINCQGNLNAYYTLLKKYADAHDGILPDSLQDLSIPHGSILTFCDPDHYEYHASGKELNIHEAEKLITDNPGRHAGNYRMMLMSDGTYQLSLYDEPFKKLEDVQLKKNVESKLPNSGKNGKIGKYE